jgi:hypothetical protein
MFFNSVHLVTIGIAAYIVMIQTVMKEHLADITMTQNTFRNKLERASRTIAI